MLGGQLGDRDLELEIVNAVVLGQQSRRILEAEGREGLQEIESVRHSRREQTLECRPEPREIDARLEQLAVAQELQGQSQVERLLRAIFVAHKEVSRDRDSLVVGQDSVTNTAQQLLHNDVKLVFLYTSSSLSSSPPSKINNNLSQASIVLFIRTLADCSRLLEKSAMSSGELGTSPARNGINCE